MTEFERMQADHEKLLSRQEDGEAAAKVARAASAYIEQALTASAAMVAPRERDQLRANLRFWASFVFDETGTYPDTTLRPAVATMRSEKPTPQADAPVLRERKESPSVVVPPQRKTRWPWFVLGGVGLVVLYIVVGAMLSSLSIINQSATERPAEEVVFTDETEAVAIDIATPTEIFGESPEEVTATEEFRPTVTAETTATPVADIFTFGEELSATINSSAHPAGCDARTVNVTIRPNEIIAAADLDGTTLRIVRAGSGEVVTTERLQPFREEIAIELGRGTADETFLLALRQPGVTSTDVIIRFVADCSRNLVDVVYQGSNTNSLLIEESGADTDMQLDWRLLSWGPSPYGHEWVASLRLEAKGGDGQYFYWMDGVILPEDQFVLTGLSCEAARRTVGVTSAGQAIVRELVLLSPYCPSD